MTQRASSMNLKRPHAVHVIQGEYAVSADKDAMLCTLLGSCVSACIRDPEARVGGLNHFLLPEGTGASGNLSYGVHAMELLINDLLRRGAMRSRLEAKLFGGARMIRSAHDIGAQNAKFARSFLDAEGISEIGGSLGGTQARRIEFWPESGRVRQQLIEGDTSLLAREVARPAPPPAEDDGNLELF